MFLRLFKIERLPARIADLGDGIGNGIGDGTGVASVQNNDRDLDRKIKIGATQKRRPYQTLPDGAASQVVVTLGTPL